MRGKKYQKLANQIREIVEQDHDYNTSAEALVEASELVFKFVAKELGNTGFQGSWASLSLLGRLNGWDSPYAVLKAEDMVYPQYPTPTERGATLATEWGEWVKSEAQRHLDTTDVEVVAPSVWAHWKGLVSS